MKRFLLRFGGSTRGVANDLKILASHGYATVGVEYSTGFGSAYPKPVQQVNAALRYLVAHVGALHIDPDRIVLRAIRPFLPPECRKTNEGGLMSTRQPSHSPRIRVPAAGRLLASCMLPFVLALAGAGAARAATLEGTATYRERMALPPGAVFEATLQDVPKGGALPKVLGRATLDPAGQPPFRFAIDYDPAAIRPGGHYVVNATVSVRGGLLFVTTAPRRVLAAGASAPVQLMLVRARSPRQSIFFKQLPASYEREVPGADSLVRWHLDLLPGGQYQLRTTYVDKPALEPIDHIGRWQYVGARGMLKLFRPGKPALQFDVEDAGGLLRPLDARGKVATSPYNVPLRRLPQPALVEPELKLTGMFSYMADAASITLCEDGRRMPVAMEGDFRALERAYMDAHPKPGQALYVRLDGRIASRPSVEESQPPRATLIVEKFTGIEPGLSCGMVATHIALRGTYWKLVQLNGQAISVPGVARQQEPHLVFSVDGDRVSGSGGCNAVAGSFEAEGDKLNLRQMVSTMRACLTGMEREREFLQTLGKVARYRIVAGHLDLLDAQGTVVARFEAVALR